MSERVEQGRMMFLYPTILINKMLFYNKPINNISTLFLQILISYKLDISSTFVSRNFSINYSDHPFLYIYAYSNYIRFRLFQAKFY